MARRWVENPNKTLSHRRDRRDARLEILQELFYAGIQETVEEAEIRGEYHLSDVTYEQIHHVYAEQFDDEPLIQEV